MITENTDEILIIGSMNKREMSKQWVNDRCAEILTNRYGPCEVFGG